MTSPSPSPITADILATFALAASLADDGGVIQAADMVGIVSDPAMHTTCTLRGLAKHLLGSACNEQANEAGDTYGDLLIQAAR